MKKQFIKYLLPLAITTILMVSCSSQRYYKMSVNNIHEFDSIISRIYSKEMLAKSDSHVLKNGEFIRYNSSCLYYEDVSDSLMKMFMKKYELKRICLSRPNNEFFDSVITFHKDYTPFMGKAIIISYDFGKSRLRDKTKSRLKLKDENVRIINNLYLYRVKSKPAFGE